MNKAPGPTNWHNLDNQQNQYKLSFDEEQQEEQRQRQRQGDRHGQGQWQGEGDGDAGCGGGGGALSGKLTGWEPLVQQNLNVFVGRLGKVRGGRGVARGKVVNYVNQNKTAYSKKKVRSKNSSCISQKNIELSIKNHIQASIQNIQSPLFPKQPNQCPNPHPNPTPHTYTYNSTFHPPPNQQPLKALHSNLTQHRFRGCEFSNIELLKFQARHLESEEVSNYRLPCFGGVGVGGNFSEVVNGSVQCKCGSNNNNRSANLSTGCYCHMIPNQTHNSLQQCQSTQINLYELTRKLRTESTKRQKVRKQKNQSQLHSSNSNHTNGNANQAGNKFYRTLTTQWSQNKNKNISLIVEASGKGGCANPELYGSNSIYQHGTNQGESNLIPNPASNKIQLDFSSLLGPRHPQQFKTIHWKKSKPFTKFFQCKRNLNRNKSASSSTNEGTGSNCSNNNPNSTNSTVYISMNNYSSTGAGGGAGAGGKNCLRQIQGRKLHQLLTMNRQIIQLEDF